MKEQNRHRLREALNELPDYDAPSESWNGINRRLSVNGLPTYAPPASTWNAINTGLDQPTVVRRLIPRWAYGAAAAVALVVAAVFMLNSYDSGPAITYAYSQEAAPAPVVADWDEDEESFSRALNEIDRRNEPALNNLGEELGELTSAREEVKAMLVAYGEDAGMVRQLADIERERSDVYRRIIVEL